MPRSAMKLYLSLVAPWANVERFRADMDEPEFVAEKTRTDWVQFKIPSRPLPGWFEQRLLGPEASAALVNLLGCVSRFNDVVDELRSVPRTKRAADKARRHELSVVLHGTIGSAGSGGMYDAFQAAKESLS